MAYRPALLLLFYSLLLTTACDEVLTVDLPEEEDFLTTYAFLPAGDTTATILVNRTYSYFEASNPEQANLQGPAEVSLLLSGQAAGAFQQRGQSIYYDGRYDPLAGPGAEYRLTVSHPGFGSMEARSPVPRRATGFSAELLEDYPLPGGEVVERAIAVTFQDPEAAGDRYEIGIQFPLGDQVDTAWFSAQPTPVELTAGSQVLDPDATMSFRFDATDSWFLDDTQLAGQPVRVILEVRQAVGTDNFYAVYLRNLTRDHFEFSRFLAAEDLGLPESFTLYPGIYSNFNNGIGFFAIYQEQRLAVPQ